MSHVPDIGSNKNRPVTSRFTAPEFASSPVPRIEAAACADVTLPRSSIRYLMVRLLDEMVSDRSDEPDDPIVNALRSACARDRMAGANASQMAAGGPVRQSASFTTPWS
jgi:hypothetical protein